MCLAPQQQQFFIVQLFISQTARWLHNRRFSEPTCQPSGAQNSGKTKFHGVSTFSLALTFFLLTLSSLTLSAPTASSAHTVGSFTSKLPWSAGYSSIRNFQCTNVLSSVYQKTKLEAVVAAAISGENQVNRTK